MTEKIIYEDEIYLIKKASSKVSTHYSGKIKKRFGDITTGTVTSGMTDSDIIEKVKKRLNPVYDMHTHSIDLTGELATMEHAFIKILDN